jgi:hypothetical protein
MARQSRKVDWDNLPIRLDPDSEPNPQNPHAASSPEERARAMSNLARQIRLRRFRRIAGN